MERQIPQRGEIWRNTKNGVEYFIVSVAMNADNAANQPVPRDVVYRHTYKDSADYTRILDEFMGTRCTGNSYVFRFEKVEDAS